MGAVNLLRNMLAHPLTRGLEIDDPRTTELRRSIVRNKPFLFRIYQEWYTLIARAIPAGDGAILELGSGAGFLDAFVPGLVTSDVFYCKENQIVLDAQELPFEDGSLRGIVMADVLHHVPQPRRFFAEATRCLRPKGVVVMIEPWVSTWSTHVYRSLHHEPFEPYSAEWEFPPAGPLSGANGAMPWIIFQRDRATFERECPLLRVRTVLPMMPFRYLVSGGVSMRSLTPAWSFPLWRAVEEALKPAMKWLAMFVLVELERI